MKNNKGFAPIAILFAVITVLAVGGVAYYTGKSSSPKNEVTDNSNYFPPVDQNYTPPVTSNTNNNVTAQDTTSNWKTYSGAEFSFKYPSAWYLSSGTGSVYITNYDSSKIPGSDAPLSKDKMAISIYTYNNLAINETVESWVNKTGLSDKRNILVDGIKAIRGKIIYTGEEESGYYQKGQSSGDDVRVVYKGKGYQIAYSPYGSKFISTFDQILSTFKFIK